MVKNPEIREKIENAHKLLAGETTTIEKFESIRKIIHGVNPRVDQQLAKVSKALSAYKKLHEGEVIELTAEHFPAKTEQQKKRKKALLLLISSWKDLKSEVERVRHELTPPHHEQSATDQALHWAKIAKFAKGPFGLVTLAALVIVGISLFIPKQTTQSSAPTNTQVSEKPAGEKETMEVITFKGKKIPVKELRIGDGPDCNSGNVPHYHALDSVSVKAIDGTAIPDPGACGYGKVSEVRIEEL